LDFFAFFCGAVWAEDNGFGNILIASGHFGRSVLDNVGLLDRDLNKTCQLTSLPRKFSNAAGGLIQVEGVPTPVVCGGFNTDGGNDLCYALKDGIWKAVLNLGARMSAMSAVPIATDVVTGNQWMFFAGGKDLDKKQYLNRTFVMNGLGMSWRGPDLKTARYGPCSVILEDKGHQKVIGVLGGKSDSGKDVATMERFLCDLDPNVPSWINHPKCTRLEDGPEMLTARMSFGCGVLSTSEGGRVLLAMKSRDIPTEILDLSSEDSTWTKIDNDLPLYEDGYSMSFVTSSQDTSMGFFLPQGTKFMYQAKCQNAKSCNFTQVTWPGYWNNPEALVTMAVPSNSDINCPK